MVVANNNEEVMLRVSSDGGQIFGDKTNLSNTTESNSTRAEVDSDANSVVVTWQIVLLKKHKQKSHSY